MTQMNPRREPVQPEGRPGLVGFLGGKGAASALAQNQEGVSVPMKENQVWSRCLVHGGRSGCGAGTIDAASL